jgi:Presenilin
MASERYICTLTDEIATCMHVRTPLHVCTLQVVLAMYDLCAVLTPCGPLKALVNLMQVP